MIVTPAAHRALLVAALLLGPWASATAEVFRVATFNVENYIDAPAGNRPAKSPEGRAKVRESIAAVKPDVLALQEVGSTNALLQLQAGLKSAGVDLPFWDEITAHDTNIHLAILSRFPIAARRPHTNDSFIIDGHRLEVSRGFDELEIQVNPRYSFTLIAAHLKSRLPSNIADEEEWRYQEAVALRHVIDAALDANADRKLIVLGDFNDVKDSKVMRVIMGRGRARLFDTRPAERNGDSGGKGHEGRTVTWTDYYAKEDTYSRIDYILVSPSLKAAWLPAETYVLSLPNWGVASDHRPVVAGFVTEDR
jgi:endonuclease/exonuclease/phosphatase family metal-dependent hydrolase